MFTKNNMLFILTSIMFCNFAVANTVLQSQLLQQPLQPIQAPQTMQALQDMQASLSKPYAVNDVLKFKRIAQVLVSPDGKTTAYITFATDPTAIDKKWRYSLFINNEANETKLLAEANHIEALQFSADGSKIAYLAPGEKYQSIYLVDVKTAAKNKLYEFNQDIQLYKWSPNEKYMAFLAANNEKNTQILKPIDVSKDYANSRLYLLPINKKIAKPILEKNISVTDIDWSADSKSLVFSFQPRQGKGYINDNKISIINIETRKISKLPYTANQTGVQPHFSPDGKWLAFASNLAPSQFATQLHNDIILNKRVCVAKTDSLATYCLANTSNQNPFILGWNATSDKVIVVDAFKLEGYRLYSLSLNANIPAQMLSPVDGFIELLTITLNKNNMLGFGYETINTAPEVYVSPIEPFQSKQVSHLNDNLLSNVAFGTVTNVHWKSNDGRDIDGLLLAPADYQPQKKYPLYVAVHSGPAGVWSRRFLGGCEEYDTMFNPTTCWQNLLNQGFVILQPNPRGSTGYGTTFRLANYGDLGGGDYRDIMAGIDYLVKKEIADPNHLAIGGWSFGGYMTAWAISQTQQFKAAIVGDGNTGFISFSGISDIPWYYEQYLGTPFWTNNKLYLERAPIIHVNNIQTPVLIMQGAEDVRVPLGQAYELYTALERQHKPVKMLLLPKQGHLPTDANVIYDSINEVNNWLKQALK